MLLKNVHAQTLQELENIPESHSMLLDIRDPPGAKYSQRDM